ncbi:unnamed protein product [Diamesa serratosioi]
MNSSVVEVPVKTLADFGYGFNDDGQLRKIDSNGELTYEGYQFEISETSTRSENQKAYEDIGSVITDYVYEYMEKHGMKRRYLPDNIPEEKATFVYCTEPELNNPKKLMVIIHGSGVVRAGQWARSLIINHSLDAGTILPYIQKARALGYEILVTNTNDNYRNKKPIPGSESPENHAVSVWEKIVKPANAEAIAIVAHSYGGHIAIDLGEKYVKDFEDKVFAVALTDSVHSSYSLTPKLRAVGINYVGSDKPLDTPEYDLHGDIKRVSAGHSKHEMTSYSCIESLFDFVEEKYKEMKAADEPIKKESIETEAGDENKDDAEVAAKKAKTDL